MVAALAYADAETFKNAGEMVGRGFAMRSPVPKAEFVAQPMCEHHGACTTDPKSIPDPNQEVLAI